MKFGCYSIDVPDIDLLDIEGDLITNLSDTSAQLNGHYSGYLNNVNSKSGTIPKVDKYVSGIRMAI